MSTWTQSSSKMTFGFVLFKDQKHLIPHKLKQKNVLVNMPDLERDQCNTPKVKKVGMEYVLKV